MKKILTIAFLLLLIVGSAFAWTRVQSDYKAGLKSSCYWEIYDFEYPRIFANGTLEMRKYGIGYNITLYSLKSSVGYPDSRVQIEINDKKKTITIDWSKLIAELDNSDEYTKIKAISPKKLETDWRGLNYVPPVNNDSDLRLWCFKETSKGVVVINSYDYNLLKSMYLDGNDVCFSIVFESGYCLECIAEYSSSLKYFLAD